MTNLKLEKFDLETFRTERFDVQLIEHDLQNLRTKAEINGKNSPKIDRIFRQIDSELMQLSALDAAENADENAKRAQLRELKNELLRLAHQLESELADDKTGKILHKIIAKLRG